MVSTRLLYLAVAHETVRVKFKVWAPKTFSEVIGRFGCCVYADGMIAQIHKWQTYFPEEAGNERTQALSTKESNYVAQNGWLRRIDDTDPKSNSVLSE